MGGIDRRVPAAPNTRFPSNNRFPARNVFDDRINDQQIDDYGLTHSRRAGPAGAVFIVDFSRLECADGNDPALSLISREYLHAFAS